jgi:hypothetical protein
VGRRKLRVKSRRKEKQEAGTFGVGSYEMTRRVDPNIEKIVGREVSQYVKDTDSRYEIERNLLLDELDEVGLDVLAVHEAAHDHYFYLSGKVVLDFEPPVVRYRKDNLKPFKKQLAGVRLRSWENFPEDPEPTWLLKTARALAAGGAACAKITTSRFRGDKDDRCRWNKVCAAAYKGKKTSTEIDSIAEKLWSRAKEEVELEFTNEDLKAQIQKRGQEIMQDLFPWPR